MARLQNQWG